MGALVAVVAGICACGTQTASEADSREFVIESTTDPVAVCGALLPGEVISRYLGYEAPSGVELSPANTTLEAHTDFSGGWSLNCGFTDRGNPSLGYRVIISPAIKHGPSGLVKANGVAVAGDSRGIVPVDEKHLIPLFGGITTRVGFSR
jgi:hypothetical protein